MKFSSSSNISVQQVHQFHISKSTPLILWSPLFSKKYLLPGQDQQNGKRTYISDYHPSPSGLTTRIYSLVFLKTTYGFILLQYICWIFSQTSISHHGCGKFPYLGCSDYWKMHWSQKIESGHFYLIPGYYYLRPN